MLCNRSTNNRIRDAADDLSARRNEQNGSSVNRDGGFIARVLSLSLANEETIEEL